MKKKERDMCRKQQLFKEEEQMFSAICTYAQKKVVGNLHFH
jgi:hypothetical protein